MKFKVLRTIKLTCYLTTALFFHSCSALPENFAGPFQYSTEALKSLIFGYEDYPISSELVESIPYASLRMKIGKGPAGLLILESKMEEKYTWVSSDQIFITTKNGRIVRAEGLNNNLLDFVSTDIPFQEIIGDYLLQESYRYVSLDNPEVFDLRLKVTYENKGLDQISILGKKLELILIEEKIHNPYIRWKHTNKFWVDQYSGYVWQSIQQIAPNVPPIFIQVTKKPSL